MDLKNLQLKHGEVARDRDVRTSNSLHIAGQHDQCCAHMEILNMLGGVSAGRVGKEL